MARASVAPSGWSLDELAKRAGVNKRTIMRHEGGESISPDRIEAMRRAFEAEGVRFIYSGSFKGGVAPPPRRMADEVGRNPLLPG